MFDGPDSALSSLRLVEVEINAFRSLNTLVCERWRNLSIKILCSSDRRRLSPPPPTVAVLLTSTLTLSRLKSLGTHLHTFTPSYFGSTYVAELDMAMTTCKYWHGSDLPIGR